MENINDFVFLDLETTGLDSYQDEIVEIGIVAGDGTILLDTLVKPIQKDSWNQAQKIHGISPEMVKDAPTLNDIIAKIKELLFGKKVVIYNAAFDFDFLPEECLEWDNTYCCMLAFSEYYGQWSDYHGNYKWHKLIKAANYVHYEFEGDSHRAFADALASRAVWLYLHDEEERKRVEELRELEAIRKKKEEEEWEISYEVERYLSYFDSNLKNKHEENQKRNHKLIFERLGLVEDNSWSKFHDNNNRLHLAFTGFNSDLWHFINGLPIHYGLKNTPKHLKSEGQIKRLDRTGRYQWLINNKFVQPEAVRATKNNQTVVKLYSMNKLKRREKKLPPLSQLYSKSYLMKEYNLKESDIKKLKIWGYKYHSYGGYYPVYHV